MPFETVNPATGARLASFALHAPAEIEARVAAATRAAVAWAATPLTVRAAHFERLADALLARAPALAHLAALEMGKPLAQGRAEVQKCVATTRYFAAHGPGWLADEELPAAPDGTGRRLLTHDPHRRGAGGDAVEFPVLAGRALRDAHAAGRQRRAGKARAQRAAVRRRPGRNLSRNAARRPLRRPARRASRCSRAAGRRARGGGVAHRLRAGGRQRGRRGGPAPQARRAGAGWLRCLRGARRRRRARRRRNRRPRPPPEHRSELHRRQTLHRGRGGLRRVPDRLSRPPRSRPRRRPHRA